MRNPSEADDDFILVTFSCGGYENTMMSLLKEN